MGLLSWNKRFSKVKEKDHIVFYLYVREKLYLLEVFQSDPLASSHKVMWEDQTIQFDGMPYFVLGQKIFDCRNGKDRKEAWKQKRKELVEKVRFCIPLRQIYFHSFIMIISIVILIGNFHPRAPHCTTMHGNTEGQTNVTIGH